MNSKHATERRSRLSEPLFVNPLTVDDDGEAQPVTVARLLSPTPPPLPSQRARFESAADVTLTVADDELEPVELPLGWAQWTGVRSTRPSVRPATAPADPLLGMLIAQKYRLLSLLGRGGMGVVYAVEHILTGELMAMKLLSGELAADPLIVQRFRHEAMATAQLDHPNTVRVFDFGESAQLVYLVMEHLTGRDLACVLGTEGPLSAERAVQLGHQVCASLAHAHERGIVHCDIKPENVFVQLGEDGSETVKVLDFGIAKLCDKQDGAREGAPILGTPCYMAPEQIRGEPMDARSDVYALGALLYKALTGVAPFAGDTPQQVLDAQLTKEPVAMRVQAPGRHLPEALDRAVLRALSKDPEQRQPNMQSLSDALLACLSEGASKDLSALPPAAAATPMRHTSTEILPPPKPRRRIRAKHTKRRLN